MTCIVFLFCEILFASGTLATSRPFQVLLTGFGPFLNFTHNPTTDIAKRLHGTCDVVDILPEPSERSLDAEGDRMRVKVCWHTHVLPANSTGTSFTTEHLRSLQLAGSQPYDAIFHTGLEDKAKGLKLEVAAANIQAQGDGSPGTHQAVDGAPELLPTTVNTGWLSLKNLVISGPPVRARHSREIELWSRDAGTYFCNEIYYRTLHYVRSRPVTAVTGALLPVMFIHVQNLTASSINQDVDSVRQIAAHALWATYLAPGPQVQHLLQQRWLSTAVASPVLCVALLCLLLCLAMVRSKLAGKPSAYGIGVLREPLNP